MAKKKGNVVVAADLCKGCGFCVEACPTEAITESKLFEFSFTNRQDAIYTKAELVVDDDGKGLVGTGHFVCTAFR
mgnify:CR=1 FL=1